MTFDPISAGWEAKRRDDFPDYNGPMWEKRENGARIFSLLTARLPPRRTSAQQPNRQPIARGEAHSQSN